MKRRRFMRVVFVAASIATLKVRKMCQRIVYPGRIVSVDEESLKTQGKWLG